MWRFREALLTLDIDFPLPTQLDISFIIDPSTATLTFQPPLMFLEILVKYGKKGEGKTKRVDGTLRNKEKCKITKTSGKDRKSETVIQHWFFLFTKKASGIQLQYQH